MKYATLIAFILLFVSVIALVRYCSNDREYAPTEREKSLQADTARQNKTIALLNLEVKSFHARAIKAEQALNKPKENRKKLKSLVSEDSLKMFLDRMANSGTVNDYIKKHGAFQIGKLIELDANADSVIEKQDTLILDLKKENLFQDSTINHLEAKVRDVSGLDTIHFQALLKEKKRNFWHKVKDWFFISLAAIMTIIAVAK